MADYLGKKIKFNIEDNDLQKIRFNKVYGESQQATRSGKNYFDASQIPSSTNIVVSDNGKTITMPIATSGGGATPTTKKLSQLCPKLKVGDIATLRFNRNLGTTKNMYIYLNVVNLTWGINNSKTITQEMLDSYVSLFANRYDDGETGQCILTDFSIMLSSETDTSWEQYGASPSPDYPSKIENLEGKNKFDINQEKEIFGIMLYKYSYYLKPNTKYTISSNCPASTTANIYANSNSSNSAVYINKNQTIQSDENGYFYILVRFKAYASDNSTFNLYEKVLNGTYYIQLEEGTVATPYVPYNSLEFKDEGKNKFNVQDTNRVTEGITVDNEGWITVIGDNTDGTATKFFNYFTNNLALKTVTNYNVIAEVKSVNGTGIVHFASNGSTSKQFETRFYRDFTNLANNKVYKLICKTADEFVGNNGLRTFVEFSAGQSGSITFRLSVLEDTTITAENFEYEEYKSQVVYFPLSEGQKLMEGSYLADDGVHNARKQRVFDGTQSNYIQSIQINETTENTTFIFSHYFAPDAKKAAGRLIPLCNQLVGTNTGGYMSFINQITQWSDTSASFCIGVDTNKIGTTQSSIASYFNSKPLVIEYELAEEEIVPYTEEQQEAWEKLRHFKGLNGENNITAQGTMTSTLDLTLYNVAEEDFDIYISKKGYFGALKYDINNLIDFMESNIPSIAEATESSVKIAGRDGDISLNTVYEPLPFEIVCYTEDNLTPEEKIIEEQKITSLLNSIKNQTKTFFMEREKKFYKVKYSGNLSVVRYPKHLKFTIPLKSSESYAMNFEESEIIGNGTKVSNTIKDTGAIFTIKGPAIKPIISLNNYQMKYNENILEGNSLIINSEDSTITHITSAGVKTNAMRAYNHEFPKIKNGENQLAVSSGIDDENQVNVKWYDLKI